MARFVPNKPFAFPPSMEVRVGGTSPRTDEGRTMQEAIVENHAYAHGWTVLG